MRICTVSLTSSTPYSQSKKIDDELFPCAPKEKPHERDEREWREKCTYNPSGIICIPAMALKMSVDEAAKRLNLQIPGRGKGTYTKFFVAGQICMADVPIGIRKEDVQSISIWANTDGVRGSGKRGMRKFPIIPEWSGEAEFAILDDLIPNEVFERALIESGRLVGIGRFRPEKGGMNGRFSVSNIRWQTIE